MHPRLPAGRERIPSIPPCRRTSISREFVSITKNGTTKFPPGTQMPISCSVLPPTTAELISFNELEHSSGTTHVRSNYTFINHNAHRHNTSSASPSANNAVRVRGNARPPATNVVTRTMQAAPVRVCASDGGTDASTSGIVVEGVRTGEEVYVELSGPRHSLGTTGAIDDRRKMIQLRNECTSLSDKLNKKKHELIRYRAVSTLLLLEAQARRALEVTCWECREDGVVELLRQLWSTNKTAWTAALAKQNEGSLSRINNLQQKLAEQASDFAKEKSALMTSQNRRAEADADAKEEKDRLLRDLEKLKRDICDQQISTALERQNMEAQLIGVREVLQRTQNSLRERDASLAQDAFLVAQCRLFIRNICQPGYHVVKGPTLEAVDKDRTEPSGFVLVPLPVLLHGYTLLPEDERRNVINSYVGN